MAAEASRPYEIKRYACRSVFALLAVLFVAANLRAPISAVGPVLPNIGRDTGMAPWQLGLLSSLPVAAFAICSPFGHRLAQRFGTDRILVAALLVLGLGTALRSIPAVSWSNSALLGGTVVIGTAIALGNVLLPVVVRRDFPAAVPRVTGYYIAVQSIVAGVASGFVVPLAQASGSWRPALALWGAFVVMALIVWAPRVRSAAPPPAEATEVPTMSGARVWRSGLAWQVAGYFGLQSSAFYVLLTWLPTIEQDLGVSDVRAGVHLAVFLAVGIVANLVVPHLLKVGGDQRFVAVLAPGCSTVAMVGIQFAPVLMPLWVGMAGLGAGASMVLSLSLISLRSAGTTVASRLSSMVQASAYAGVVLALLAAGSIRDLVGHGSALVFFVLLLVAGQAAMGMRVGRDRRVDT